MSTDLYKVYGNGLLDRLVASLLGTWIGDICCVAPACADDLALSSDSPSTIQRLVNIGVDFSIMEKFLLRPNKSVVLSHLCATDSKLGMTNDEWTIYDEPMSVVKEAMQMGILRSHCTEESVVTDNIKKARRTVYSLMSSGLHGHNGLDPETCIQLLMIYILPLLVCGLEVILPGRKYLDMLVSSRRSSNRFSHSLQWLPTVRCML